MHSMEGKREVGPTGEVTTLGSKLSLRELTSKMGDRATHSKEETLKDRLVKSKKKYDILAS